MIHLAPASNGRSIKRAGLKGRKARLAAEPPIVLAEAVFAMPVLVDFWTTYQWLRELRQVHDERMIAVYFRVEDSAVIYVGRYNEPHQTMTATKAASWVGKNPAGAQVVIPRGIPAKDVLRIREMTQRVGWTNVPASEKKWECLCSGCVPRGTRDLMRRVRRATSSSLQAARAASSDEELLAALNSLDVPLERADGRLGPDRLLRYARSPNPLVRRVTTSLLAHFKPSQVLSLLLELIADPEIVVRQQATETLLRVAGAARAARLLIAAEEDVLICLAELMEFEVDPGRAGTVLQILRQSGSELVRHAVTRTAVALLADDELKVPERALLEEMRA